MSAQPVAATATSSEPAENGCLGASPGLTVVGARGDKRDHEMRDSKGSVMEAAGKKAIPSKPSAAHHAATTAVSAVFEGQTASSTILGRTANREVAGQVETT
jgi:hypothetical protein